MSAPESMPAVEITRFGDPSVLRLGERARPVPGPGEVLIEVSASGVNRPDVLQRKGLYPMPPGVTDIPGLEVAGRIVEGDAAALREVGLALGDRVCALVAGGGYARWCTVPAGQCLPVPAGWSDVEAAGLPETCFTVWSNVFDRVGLKAGETLLVHGGSSGIGVTAIQMAKAFGARVLVTVGSDDKAAACRGLGADVAINYRTQDFVDAALEATGKRGVDVVLDMVAGDYVEREVRCLAEDGRIAIIAIQGGTASSFDAGLVLRRRLTITASTLRPRSVAFKSAIARSLREKVWPHLEARRVKPVVFATFAPGDAAAAHALMESNRHIGKIVLDWSKHAGASQ